MPISHAIILGLVQGLTEFLPISSSGHLLIVPWLFNWDDFDNESIEKAFDVALHIGTLIAAIVYFRHDLVRYIKAGLAALRPDGRGDPDGRVAWMLLLSTVPAAVVGAVFEDSIDENLGTPTIIAISLILGGLLLGVADRVPGDRTIEDMQYPGCRRHRGRPGARPQSRHVTIGHHDDGRTVRSIRPRCRGSDQLPDDDPRDGRGRGPQDGRPRR